MPKENQNLMLRCLFLQCETGHAKLVAEMAKNLMTRKSKEEYPRLQNAIDQTAHFALEIAKTHQNVSHQVKARRFKTA